MASGSENRSTANRLLLALAPEVFGRIGPHLERVEIERRQTIYRLGAAVEYLYFVDCGLISLVKTMRDGRTVEIGAIGIEGVSGSEALYGVNGAPLEAIVQIPGEAFRIRRDVLRREMDQNSVLRSLLMRYVHFAIGQLAQTAACNRLHSLEERCCRWLLIAHDNAREGTFSLTHEFLAMMLGVSRTGLSLTASILQRAGLIHYRRGRVTVLDRVGLEEAACECYGAMREDIDGIFSG